MQNKLSTLTPKPILKIVGFVQWVSRNKGPKQKAFWISKTLHIGFIFKVSNEDSPPRDSLAPLPKQTIFWPWILEGWWKVSNGGLHSQCLLNYYKAFSFCPNRKGICLKPLVHRFCDILLWLTHWTWRFSGDSHLQLFALELHDALETRPKQDSSILTPTALSHGPFHSRLIGVSIGHRERRINSKTSLFSQILHSN